MVNTKFNPSPFPLINIPPSYETLAPRNWIFVEDPAFKRGTGSPRLKAVGFSIGNRPSKGLQIELLSPNTAFLKGKT